jgi:hypothetical protein
LARLKPSPFKPTDFFRTTKARGPGICTGKEKIMLKREGSRAASLSWAAIAVLAVTVLSSGSLMAQNTAKQVAIPLPPMGWSSWNSFSNTINSDITMAQAKAMVSTGMVSAGYQYINIDEGWWLGQRDTDGNIVVDPKAWPAITAGEKPGDMTNIVRYIHSLGLKAGIYTDAGTDGCGTVGPDLGPGYPNEGSEGHYEQDFLQFARWGFDYVKVDWCGGDKENLDPAVQYAEIARAIARAESITGHSLYFSICNWGKNSPATWAPGVGGVTADIWRTGGDIVAPIVAGTSNANRRAELKEVFREFDEANHPEAEHTGFYNDPDMMVVGMPGLTDAQNRVHMGLWAMSGGPLLVGADLTRLSDATLATLTNPAVIAIDQDALGLQAVKVAEVGKGLEVWAKPLAKPGSRAVILLNRTTAAASISFRPADLALIGSASGTITDLWTGKDQGALSSSYSATVPAADAILLRIQGKEAALTTYKPTTSNSQEVIFPHVSAKHPISRVEITYTNPTKSTRLAELRVNGRIATRIAFPPTGAVPAIVTIQSQLDRSGANNELVVSTPTGQGPAIQSIAVQ